MENLKFELPLSFTPKSGDRRSKNGKDQTPVPRPVFHVQKTPKSLSIKRSKRSRMEQNGEDFEDGGSASKKSLSSKRLLLSNQLARRRLDLGTPNSLHGDGTAKAISFETPNTPLLYQSSYVPRKDKDYFDQFFRKIRELGEGDFGQVFEAEKKTDGKRVAIKKSHQVYLSVYQRKQMLQEVQAHEAIPPHVNLLKFEQAWEEKGFLYIQTELCQCSLQHYMDEKPVDDVMAWNLMCDILTGLAHIHDHQYIHLDIKADNILIGQDGRYKIGDFGLLTKLDGKNRDLTEGDNRTLAPELLNNEYTTKADVFSLGITVLGAICDIELPKNGDLWQKFRSGDPFSDWGETPKPFINVDMTDMILKMLEPDHLKRPSCRELLQSNIMRRMTLTLLLTRRATNNNPEDANNMSPGIYRQRSPAITPSSNRRPASLTGNRTPLCGSPMKSPAVSPLSSRQEKPEKEEEESVAADMSFTECTPEAESKSSLKCSVSKNLFGAFDDLSSDEELF
ncbi:Oidioi.mRNA.OKI2018_I69.chr2.g7033.t1.cds [Oikopleura dioica]|uniref:non-specific serine/threonine protein kinase n=1 Tax=Oikopleura dioica TaxID=34765 RepID=A0ABN7T5B4_OIKDI|nr:Oidioi.mRNA.OKI2018_I69.chr2.g7033.t1.cds [Oikopleura dioica]